MKNVIDLRNRFWPHPPKHGFYVVKHSFQGKITLEITLLEIPNKIQPYQFKNRIASCKDLGLIGDFKEKIPEKISVKSI